MSNPNPPAKIFISSNGNLDIHLFQKPNNDTIPSTETFTSLSGKQEQGRLMAIMTVSREVLIASSETFRVQLTRWDKDTKAVEAEVDTLPSIEVVLRALHHTISENNAMYSVETEDVWEVIQYCDYRGIDVKNYELKVWFCEWLEVKRIKMDFEDMKSLLYPAYIFDHAKGFATMTKALAYNTIEHITERNPTRYNRLHLDGNAIGAINGARGSLRTKLLRGIFGEPLEKLLVRTCSCHEKSIAAYLKALRKNCGIWPLHDQHQRSVQSILRSPGFLKFDAKSPKDACIPCRQTLREDAITELRIKVADDFDGLCLDCMKMTKLEDVDEDYWEHDRLRCWDRGCRIAHNQPTWYFSFMGRKTYMHQHQLNMKEKRGPLRT